MWFLKSGFSSCSLISQREPLVSLQFICIHLGRRNTVSNALCSIWVHRDPAPRGQGSREATSPALPRVYSPVACPGSGVLTLTSDLSCRPLGSRPVTSHVGTLGSLPCGQPAKLCPLLHRNSWVLFLIYSVWPHLSDFSLWFFQMKVFGIQIRLFSLKSLVPATAWLSGSAPRQPLSSLPRHSGGSQSSLGEFSWHLCRKVRQEVNESQWKKIVISASCI